MTSGFRPAPGGGATIVLHPEEAGLLRRLAELILDLVAPPPDADEFSRMVGIGASSDKPDDPVLARLFPDAYADDAEAAGEFRRYTEDELRRSKRRNARTMAQTLPGEGGTVTLDADQAQAWLKALNDLRLSLGTRLGVDEDSYEDPAFLRSQETLVYHWLGELQDTLVDSLARSLPEQE